MRPFTLIDLFEQMAEVGASDLHLCVGSPPVLRVRGVRLNDLVGKRFAGGEVECYGVELCEPCEHLESMTRPGIIKDLVHRAGINADILSDGVIRVGDASSV